MTRTLLLPALLLAVIPAFAGSANPAPWISPQGPVVSPTVIYDSAEVAASMRELEALEQYVLQEHATLEDVKARQPELLAGLNLVESDLLAQENGPLGVPSLVWGLIGGVIGCCLLGGVAVLVVYLVTDDKQEAKRALLGCILGSLVAGAISFLLRAAGYITI